MVFQTKEANTNLLKTKCFNWISSKLFVNSETFPSTRKTN